MEQMRQTIAKRGTMKFVTKSNTFLFCFKLPFLCVYFSSKPFS